MGFVTNLLNPKIAMFYLALLPEFIDPASGSVLTQSLALGAIQIVDQRQRQCDDRAGRRLDRAVPRHAADLAADAALADGHRAGGACDEDGVRGEAGVAVMPAHAGHRSTPRLRDSQHCCLWIHWITRFRG